MPPNVQKLINILRSIPVDWNDSEQNETEKQLQELCNDALVSSGGVIPMAAKALKDAGYYIRTVRDSSSGLLLVYSEINNHQVVLWEDTQALDDLLLVLGIN